MNDCLAFRNYFKLAHKETLRNRRLDALVTAIAENPLPDHFLSESSLQNSPPKNPFANWENPLATKVSVIAKV